MTAAEQLAPITDNTEVVRIVRDVQASNSKLTFADIVTALRVLPTEVIEDNAPVSKSAPKAVTVSEDHAKALAALPALVDSFKFPTVRRALSASEREDTNTLVATVKEVGSLVKALEEQLRVAFLNHGDVTAEVRAEVDEDTPRDGKGHYLIEDVDGMAIKGQTEKVWRKLTPPKMVLLPEDLDDLVTSGELEAKDVRAVVKTVRVVDESKLLQRVAKDPTLAPKFAKAARLAGGSVAMTLGTNAS